MKFHKYHGTGNDFILIDGRDARIDRGRAFIARLCDRRFGIGADGLIILENAGDCDFRMVYYNSDGNESTMCGNGGRCIVAYADFLSLIHGNARFLAVDGQHEGIVLHKDGDHYLVKIKMNDVPEIRMRGEEFVLDTGSPHLVKFSTGIKDIDVPALARPVRFHSDFEPGGINVNFVEISDNILMVRSYERGVEDETLSCGTGVTASALAYAYRTGLNSGSIAIRTLGGDLTVTFTRKEDGGFTDIWLEGPAERVYEGVLSFEF